MNILRVSLCVLATALPAVAQKVTYDEFTNLLAQSERLSDEKRFDRAIKDNPMHTLTHYRGLVLESMSGRASDTNDGDRKKLSAGWQRVYEGATLDRVDRWMQSIGESGLASNEKTRQALNQAYAELTRLNNNKGKDRQPYEALCQSLMQISRSFESVGNALGAADAWGLTGQVYVAMPEATISDRKEAIFAINRFLEHRNAWEWKKDDSYLRNANWVKAEEVRIKDDEKAARKREAEGYTGEVRGTDSFLVPDADKVETKVPLKFKVLSKPKTDMCVQGGPIPMLWPRIDVLNTGPQHLLWFKGADLYLVRPGTTKYGITLDGTEANLKKNKFTPVNAANKVKKTSKFFLDADKKRPYAMWFFYGGSQQSFMGYNQNLEPRKDSATLYYKSASSWTASIDGTNVVFYDDNNNGKLFEEDPFEYGLSDRHVGKSPDDEVRIPAFDGVQIGKSKIVHPYSSWMKIDETWYHVRGHDDGTSVGVRPTNAEYFKTGMVQLDWAAPKGMVVEAVIIEGQGDFATARFNLVGGDPIEVPTGKYRVMYGRATSGRGARLMTCNIFQGSSELIEVEEGKTATFALGAPFQLDFEKEGKGDRVKINALKMRVRGRSGEIYTHVNGATPAPDVIAAKDDSGKGAKTLGSFVAVTDGDLANRLASQNPKLGSHVGFYPAVKGDSKGAIELEVSVPRGYKIGLRQPKNKMFGSLQPIFK